MIFSTFVHYYRLKMSKFKDKSKAAWSEAWDSENIGSSISGITSGLEGVLGAFGNNNQIADTTGMQNTIDDVRYQRFNYGDYDSLAQAIASQQYAGDVDYGDIRGSTEGEQWFNVGKGALSGAAAGAKIGGPYGAIIGGAIGLGSGLIGKFTGDAKAQTEKERLELEGKRANLENLRSQIFNAGQIGNKTFNTSLLHIAAYGGMIDNYDKSKIRLKAYGGKIQGFDRGSFPSRLVDIDEGGSHETNPLGGVMLGIDQEGVPNLAEEGETVLDNNYVFSKRLKADEGILDSVNLPKKYKGKSFAEISRKLGEESKNRLNDPISQASFEDAMMKLVTAQEEIRQREQDYEDFETLENTFAEGGSIYIKPSKRGTFTAAARARGLGVQEFASKVLANKEKYSDAMIKKAQFAHNSAGWKHSFGGNLKADGSWLRFVPAVASGIQTISDDLGFTNQEDYSNPDMIQRYTRGVRNVSATPVGGYVTPQRFDLEYQQGKLRNLGLATQRGALDLSGGNRGTARNTMLALNNNLVSQSGDLYKQAFEEQRNADLAAARFNLGINQFNVQQFLEAQRANQARDLSVLNEIDNIAKFRDNIETALAQSRNLNRTNFYNNLGQVGVDRFNRNTALNWLKNKGLLDEYIAWEKQGKE